MRTTLFVRDPSGVIDDEIYDYTQFDGIIRDNDVGSWALKLPSGRMADKLSTPGAGLVAERDGKYLLSGNFSKSEPKWSESTDEVVFSGLTDNRLLWDLIAFPSLSDFERNDGKAFADDAYDVRSGAAETVLKGYVGFNTASADRRAPKAQQLIIAADKARGKFVTGRARFQILGDLLQELAAIGEISFDVLDGAFEINVPRDLRREQVFSLESGNIESFDFAISAPSVTTVLVAGGGEAEERVFMRRQDLQAEKKWNLHVEQFRDERSTSDFIELAQAADQQLIEGGEISTVDLRAIDVESRAYGKDWNVGDLVTVQDIESKVREAKITLDGDGETVTPTIDSVTTVTAQSMIQIYDAVRSMKRRINALERTR